MGPGLFILLVPLLIFTTVSYITGGFVNSLLLLDVSGLYLSFMSTLFMACFYPFFISSLGLIELTCVVISLLASIMCFLSNKMIVFWLSYEVTMLPLLISLLAKSPYSERFIAGWYLVSYIMLTGLPMLFCLIYLFLLKGSLSISLMSYLEAPLIKAALLLLFLTKVPMPPFHSWLPVVHAEASTFVSICLSGYVMKLGLMGLIRFCSEVFYSMNTLISLGFCFSLLFLLSSGAETDSKRWLAFLSLSHILIPLLGYKWLSLNNSSVVFFCLGHGISAGLLFYLFMCCYTLTGSRNWLIVGMAGKKSGFIRCLLVASLLTVASFPPSISFLSEVFILVSSLPSGMTIKMFSAYLLVGGLVPVVLLAYTLCSGGKVFGFKDISVNSGLLTISLVFAWFMYGLCL